VALSTQCKQQRMSDCCKAHGKTCRKGRSETTGAQLLGDRTAVPTEAVVVLG